MYKVMLLLSALFQLVITTSVELLGNERGEIITDPPPTPPVEEVIEKVEPPVEETKTPQQIKNELLREISQEHGINLFEADGIKKFKEFQDSQKTAQEKLNEQLDSYKEKEAEWETERLGYASKLKASELGIPQDKLEDALKLAGGNPDNLVEVLKKYPIFKSNKGINIGVQNPNEFQEPGASTQAEQYKASNPHIYKK